MTEAVTVATKAVAAVTQAVATVTKAVASVTKAVAAVMEAIAAVTKAVVAVTEAVAACVAHSLRLARSAAVAAQLSRRRSRGTLNGVAGAASCGANVLQRRCLLCREESDASRQLLKRKKVERKAADNLKGGLFLAQKTLKSGDFHESFKRFNSVS